MSARGAGACARPSRRRTPRRVGGLNHRGQKVQRGTALVEVTWLAILLLVPLVYVVLAVFDVQRAAFAVSAATRSAGRAFVTAPSQAAGRARVEAAVRVALTDQHVDPAGATVSVSCRPRPDRCLRPGSVVTVTVRTQVALPFLPPVLGDQAPSVAVSAEHSVPYGQFREARP